MDTLECNAVSVFSLRRIHKSLRRQVWPIQMSEQIIENTEMPLEGLIEPEIAQNDEQDPVTNQDTAEDTSGRLDLLKDRSMLTVYHDMPL